jgi:orotate phosphoribosyltransferase
VTAEGAHADAGLENLTAIIAKYARNFESPLALGPHGTLRFRFFNDLLSASHVETHLAIMADALVSLIRASVELPPATMIACPKRGNSLLGYKVAGVMGLQSLFVRDEALASRFVEGSYGKGANVILVDDVSSDGDLLLDAVDGLRREGLNVQQAYTVVDRGEGNAVAKLATEGIQLRACLSLTDDDVKEYVHKMKTQTL